MSMVLGMSLEVVPSIGQTGGVNWVLQTQVAWGNRLNETAIFLDRHSELLITVLPFYCCLTLALYIFLQQISG